MRRGIVPDYGPADLQRWLRRLPIRWRLTLVFSGVMAVVMAGLLAFVYLHFRSDLDYNINQSLQARAQDLAGILRQENAADIHGALRRLPAGDDAFVQVLDRSGRVLGATPGVASPALLSAPEVRKGAQSARLIERGERERLYVLPLRRRGTIVVAGVSLGVRDAALDKLERNLAIAVPPALLLATLAAYALAAAALAPVERMRQRASMISTDEISTRLPLPDSQDEIRRLGQTLNAMLDRLEDGLNHERMFIASASHELRMPLAVLRAELEVSLRERGDEAQLRAALSSAIEETDRIVKLAEDLLLLARAEDGTLPIHPVSLAVGELLADLAEHFSPIVTAAGRSLEIAPGEIPEQMTVHADPSRLTQAIGNVVDNSLRYGAGTITLVAEPHGPRIELHVCDEGEGFSDWLLPRAFDRFSRADPARQRGGVGLGLAVVQMIAQAHHGRAGASNRPGGGADVWLALPVGQPAGASSTTQVAHEGR